MKKLYFLFTLLLALACESVLDEPAKIDTNPEALAKTYCGSCHVFPEPSLLSKEKWKVILPRMAPRLGIHTQAYNPYNGLKRAEKLKIRTEKIYPEKPILADSLWQKIESYYLAEAPDSFSIKSRIPFENNSIFESQIVKLELGMRSFISMLEFDNQDNLFLSSWNGDFLQLNNDLSVKKGSLFPRPMIDFDIDEKGELMALSIGKLYPNEGAFGALVSVDTLRYTAPRLVMADLERPVHFGKGDFNQDGLTDLVICNFGNTVGSLSWYQNTGSSYLPVNIKRVPGATRVEVLDLDKDGDDDLAVLFAQGDEGISFFYNEKGRFREKRILRFNPLYGSNDFELIDFDQDGDLDVVYCNGDNGDHSNILKAYHGVRVFINEKDEFKEAYFFPMFGASKVRARDYDQDGDIDIVAASFFPDMKNGLKQSVVYLEQTNSLEFKANHFEHTDRGRWMVMDAGDIDKDGDIDVVLGSFTLTTQGIDRNIVERWRDEQNHLLVLENKQSNN